MKKTLFTALLFVFLSCYIQSQWVSIGTLSGTGANFPSVSAVNDSVVWIAGGNSGTPVIYRSINGGTNFTSVTPPPCFEISCINALSADECFAGDGGSSGYAGGNAKLYHTTNAGSSWVLVNQTGGSSGFFNDIIFSKVNPNTGVAVSNPPAGSNQPYYLLKTTNFGNNWVVENPPAVSGSNGIWHCVIIYDATAYGFGISGGIIPRLAGTTDGGTTWATFPILILGGALTSFAYSDLNTIAICANASVVARTSDQGLSWQTVNNGGALCLRWIPGTDICYFLSGTLIKKSTDEGLTWNTMTMPSVSGLKHFDFAESGGNIYGYGINNSGTVIKLSDVITGIQPVNNIIPKQFRLFQNYPNPFNPMTKIRFNIPPLEGVRGRIIKLNIYDILGREIETLVNEGLYPGTYEVTFDASNLPSGVYYYKLIADGYSDTKKMIVLK